MGIGHAALKEEATVEFPSIPKPLRVILVLCLALVGLSALLASSRAQSSSLHAALTDQTPTEPLLHPFPGVYEARYVSGFGLDDAFTVFFEDRSVSPSPIAFVSTTTGATGFGPVATQTNMCAVSRKCVSPSQTDRPGRMV